MFTPEQKTYYVLDFQEFDRLVNDTFHPKTEYDCISSNEWGNDELHSFDTSLELTEQELPSPENWLQDEDGCFVSTWLLLAVMAKLEVIPEGDYLINISW